MSPAVYEFPEFIEHTFPLRRELPLRLAIPIDLTHADVERLARFLHTLVLDEDAPPQASGDEWGGRPAAVPPALPAPPADLEAHSEAHSEPADEAPAAPLLRRGARVQVVAGGGLHLVDLWGCGLGVPTPNAARDAARIVSGAVEPWPFLVPLAEAGGEIFAGSHGGTVAEAGGIVSYRGKAHTVLLHDHKSMALSLNNDPGAQKWSIEGTAQVQPITLMAHAPRGTRIYRLAWACAEQALELVEADRLPGDTCKFVLRATKPATEIRLFWAMWVG